MEDTAKSALPAASVPPVDEGQGDAAPSSSKPGAVRTRPDPVASLKRHPLLAFMVVLVVSALGVPLAFLKGKPVYAAAAVIYVSPRFQANLQDAKEFELQSNTQYREYVQQQVRTINRYDIVEDALKRLGPLQSAVVTKGETMRHAIERLQGGLDISPIPDTYQIVVTLQGDKREGLAEMVNTVVKVFLEKSKVEEFFASDQRLQNLDEDRARLQKEIEEKQSKRTELAQELGVTTFTDNYVNPYDRLLVDAKEALAAAVRARIESQAQFDAVDPASKSGPRSLEAYAQDLASKDPALTSIQSNLNQRRSTLLTASSGLSPEHPGRKAAEREIAELEKERERIYQGLLKEFSSMILRQRQSDAFRSAQVVKKLSDEVDAQASQASWFTTKYQEGRTLGLDIDRARKRQDSIEERVSFLSLERRAPGFVRLFSEARQPGDPIKGGKTKLLAMAILAGLLLGLIAPTAVDVLDPRLHLPGDAEAVMGIEATGWLLKKNQAGPDFAVEQMHRLGSRIIQEIQNHGSRIFAFTSVKAGGGTTTIVTELARALTRVGVATLAVEANAYRADARYRSAGARGLTVVLRGGDHLDAAIVPGDDELPDHIPVGDVESETALPDLLNLISLLKDAASTYGAILIDLPPLLVSADAELIARAADVTVLIVEANAVTRPELQAAAKTLERVQPKAVSLVVNKVDILAGGGFGSRAKVEFETGEAPPTPKWAAPWLWR